MPCYFRFINLIHREISKYNNAGFLFPILSDDKDVIIIVIPKGMEPFDSALLHFERPDLPI
jgi:hypothetical protein